MQIPENGFYYHYKHDEAKGFNDHAYEVFGIARHTEEKGFLVLYKPLYENDWFIPANYQARPLDMFNEDVIIDGKSVPRFTKITDLELIEKLKLVKNTI